MLSKDKDDYSGALDTLDLEGLRVKITHNKNKITEAQDIYIFGAGSSGLQIFDILMKSGVKVRGFIDNHKTEVPSLPNVSVYDLERGSMIVSGSALVIISVFSYMPYSNVKAICRQLENYGIGNYMTYMDFYHVFSIEIGNNYWLAPMEYYADKLDKLIKVRKMLSDSESIELFDRMIAFRFSLDYGFLPSPDFKNHYFPPDLLDVKRINAYVSCGAYVGDTFEDLLRRGAKPSEAYLFEPDLSSFVELNKHCYDKEEIKISLIPCGLWDREIYLPFSENSELDSRIAEDGKAESHILCVSIDNVIQHRSVDFIKMDIEGAELKALHGAYKTIRNNRPMLAISVYHKPEDIWSVPFFIESICPDYNYSLRLHGENLFDVVCYAIPKEYWDR